MGPLLDVYVQRNSDKDGKYLITNWDSLDRIQAEVNSTRVDKGVTLVFITILHFYGICHYLLVFGLAKRDFS